MKDHALEMLDRPAVRDEVAGQPVEQLRMRRGSLRRPKSLGVVTMPRPKCCSQTRLTNTRAVSGFSGARSRGRVRAGRSLL